MAREDDSDSRPLGATPQRVHFGGHRNTCRCALFSREKVNQKSSLGKYHLGRYKSSCAALLPSMMPHSSAWLSDHAIALSTSALMMV
jgi:hypothetical protein